MKLRIEEIRKQLTSGKRIMDVPLKVTYYARVSTEGDKQFNSLTNQKTYFEEKIHSNPAWVFIPGYIDEGVTGTSTRKRTEFLRMVSDAKSGMFDLILTKEVSRFARDLLDSINYTRELLSYDVGGLFEDTGLNTIDPDAEFRLAIMATIAQEESRKLSERVKFGWKRAQEAGKRHGATAPIGYVFHNMNNGYRRDPETAPAVEYIYRRYAQNVVGTRAIAQELKELGYLNRNGNMYYPSTIRRIIQNPLYKGYIVSRKSTSLSYRGPNRKYLSPEEWLIHYDPERVPPLITGDEWEAANHVAQIRGEFMKDVDCDARIMAGGKYPYTGKIACVAHQCNFQRAQQYWYVSGEQKKSDYWRCACYKRTERDGGHCPAPLLHTDQLNQMMLHIFQTLIDTSENTPSISEVLKQASFTQTHSFRVAALDEHASKLQSKKAKLLRGWIDGIVQDQDYFGADHEICERIRRLEEQKAQCIANEPQTVQMETANWKPILQNIISTPEGLNECIRCLIKQIRVEPIAEDNKEYVLKVIIDLPGILPSASERYHIK